MEKRTNQIEVSPDIQEYYDFLNQSGIEPIDIFVRTHLTRGILQWIFAIDEESYLSDEKMEPVYDKFFEIKDRFYDKPSDEYQDLINMAVRSVEYINYNVLRSDGYHSVKHIFTTTR